MRAIQQGCSGRYVLFADLITQLYHSVADHSQAKVLRKYVNCDVLQVDELGYIETEPAQVGLFFTLMVAAFFSTVMVLLRSSTASPRAASRILATGSFKR